MPGTLTDLGTLCNRGCCVEKLLMQLTLSHIQKICSRRLLKCLVKNRETLLVKEQLLYKVKNIVEKGEIAHNEQFLLL